MLPMAETQGLLNCIAGEDLKKQFDMDLWNTTLELDYYRLVTSYKKIATAPKIAQV